MTEPSNLAEAFRDRTEALDALGRAVVARNDAWWTPGTPASIRRLADDNLHGAGIAYYEAHKTVQKFLNGDS